MCFSTSEIIKNWFHVKSECRKSLIKKFWQFCKLIFSKTRILGSKNWSKWRFLFIRISRFKIWILFSSWNLVGLKNCLPKIGKIWFAKIGIFNQKSKFQRQESRWLAYDEQSMAYNFIGGNLCLHLHSIGTDVDERPTGFWIEENVASL